MPPDPQNQPGTPPPIDYDALAQQHGAQTGEPIDYDRIARLHGAQDAPLFKADKTGSPNLIDPKVMEQQIRDNPFRVLQIPFEQMGISADRSEKQIHDKILADAAAGKGMTVSDYVKHSAVGMARDLSNTVAGAASPTGIATAIGATLAPEVAAPIMLAHGGYTAATEAPKAANPDDLQKLLFAGSEIAGAGAMGMNVLAGKTPIQEMWKLSANRLRRLSGALQTPQEAAEIPPAGQRVPALRVSNQNVIDEATNEGIDLTAGQATREPWVQTIQAMGEKTTLPGGQDLNDALMNMRFKFEQSVENFARRHDPHALGASPESAGGALRNSGKIALEVAKNNAEIAYKQAGIDQANLAGDVTNLRTWTDSIRNVKQPGAAVARPEYQTPAVSKALEDIADAPDRLGKSPSIQSMRNLRTEFWEKSQDYTGQIPDSARRLYSQAAAKVDDAMMQAAQGTPFEQSFRDASSQWKALKQKFDEPGTPLNRLMSAKDNKGAIDTLMSRKSAEDVMALKNEQIDLAPLQHQVLEDIAAKKFSVKGNTLAGYSDGFLQQLYGPDATRELYVKGEIGRRLGLEVNPSGTGRVNIARDELGWKPWNWVRGEAAAHASMPRNPQTFVGSPAATPRVTSLRLKPAMLSAMGTIPVTEEAQQ